MEDKIMILDHIDDIVDGGDVVGKQVFDSTGASVKVKGGGRGMPLKTRWDELQIGRAYSFVMGEFRPPDKPGESYPFVKDFKSVESAFVKEAQRKVETKTTDTKNRAFALSYAKDLVIGIIQAKPTLLDSFKTPSDVASLVVNISKKHFEPYLSNDHLVAEAIKEGAEVE